MDLSSRAAQVGTRTALLGAHRGEVFIGDAFDESRDPLKRYYRGYPKARDVKTLRLQKREHVWVGEYGGYKTWDIKLAWPESLIPTNVWSQEYRVDYDPGKNIAYLCRNGTLSAWDCSVQPPKWKGAVQFGKKAEKDYHPWKLEPFVPSEEHKLWTVQPTFLQLLPSENAKVALIFCNVLNIYGADRTSEAYTGVDGFGVLIAIDLRNLKLVKQAYYAEKGKIIDLGKDGLFAGHDLAGVSVDGSVMVFNRGPIGTEVWAFPEPGIFISSMVSGYDISGMRGDGNALLHRLVYSSSGDTNQEIMLEWQYKPESSEVQEFESELSEEDFYRALRIEKPGEEEINAVRRFFDSLKDPK